MFFGFRPTSFDQTHRVPVLPEPDLRHVVERADLSRAVGLVLDIRVFGL